MSLSAAEVVSTITGMRHSAGSDFSSCEHLAAVLARQVEVEQHELRPRGLCVEPLAAQEGERLLAVADDVQVGRQPAALEHLACEPRVGRVVLDQQDLDRAVDAVRVQRHVAGIAAARRRRRRSPRGDRHAALL